jgi:hypothetical protein
LPMILVFQTPFLVVVASQILAIAQANRDFLMNPRAQGARESIFQTLIGHYIPARVFLLGGLLGALNTVIVSLNNEIATGSILPLTTVLISQAFFLPILFGLASQSLAYRRAFAQLARRTSQAAKGD